MCVAEPRPIDLICGFSHITAGVPQTIPVQVGGTEECFCGESIQCTATVTGESTLELQTGLCEEEILCEACLPFVEGECELPPLEEGQWSVVVNGAPAFTLHAIGSHTRPERGSVCLRSAAVDPFCPPGELIGGEYVPSLACHPTAAFRGTRVPIRVVDACRHCGAHAGPCRVTVFDAVIRVEPSYAESACDVDCPSDCSRVEDVCYTPPLSEGVWRVLVGDYESTLVVGHHDPVEICGPFEPH